MEMIQLFIPFFNKSKKYVIIAVILIKTYQKKYFIKKIQTKLRAIIRTTVKHRLQFEIPMFSKMTSEGSTLHFSFSSILAFFKSSVNLKKPI
jgi:hypothetical protein